MSRSSHYTLHFNLTPQLSVSSQATTLAMHGKGLPWDTSRKRWIFLLWCLNPVQGANLKETLIAKFLKILQWKTIFYQIIAPWYCGEEIGLNSSWYQNWIYITIKCKPVCNLANVLWPFASFRIYIFLPQTMNESVRTWLHVTH